ncbi:sorting nexin-24-like [Hetaerina americana]|uniref:sorting nexin-24-like n=1 Tax=Hetaerina americana TaxID=62018 RepID=UPI003A7F43A5
MIKVHIPQYRLVEKLSRKPFYVYVVEIVDGGDVYRVEKRYSAFHSLHRELRKQYETAAFPPKRVRNSNHKVLEQRKQALESYLQAMLKYTPTRSKVLSFLGIQKPSPSVESLNAVEEDYTIEHQPIYVYKKDPFIDADRNWRLSNSAVEGTFMAMFGDFYCGS